MGDDTIYSGTVAAAAEGFLLGIPSIALSLASKTGKHFESGIGIALQMVERMRRAPFGEPLLLNVNIPDLPAAELKGTEVTRLGKRHKAEPVVKMQTPRGETGYWIGPAGGAADAGPGTDFFAVENGRVSVTPLRLDLTHGAQLVPTKEWLAK
jgi:5'-nucleotidase